MRNRLVVGGLLLGTCLLAGSALEALAREATISLGRDPEPPFCVLNPDGTVDINWDIEHETTPNFVYYKLEDPTRTIILEDQNYPGNTGITVNRQWTVPNGLSDGKYWVRVEYWSFEASNEANAEVTFYVCNSTGSVCAYKYADTNCNGVYDPGVDEAVPNWWICLETPFGDTFCRSTDANGQVCWEGLPLGDYTIFEPPVSGWTPIGPSSYDFALGDAPESFDFLNSKDSDCLGACCLPDGTCIVTTESACAEQDGEYYGGGTSCDGIECVVPTIESSWGEIKNIYR